MLLKTSDVQKGYVRVEKGQGHVNYFEASFEVTRFREWNSGLIRLPLHCVYTVYLVEYLRQPGLCVRLDKPFKASVFFSLAIQRGIALAGDTASPLRP